MRFEKKNGMRILMIVVLAILFAGTATAAINFKAGFQNIGSKIGPALQTPLADFAILFLIFFSVAWLAFSKWFETGSNAGSKGAVIALSVSLGLAMSAGLVFGAKFSINKMVPFATLLLVLMLFIMCYFLLTKLIFKNDKLTDKLLAIVIALIVTAVAVVMIVSMMCEDNKCETNPLLRSLVGSDSMLGKWLGDDTPEDEVEKVEKESDKTPPEERTSAASLAKIAAWQKYITETEAELPRMTEEVDCELIDRKIGGISGMIEKIKQEPNSPELEALETRADSLFNKLTNLKNELQTECFKKANWLDIIWTALTGTLAVIASVGLFFGKRIKKLYTQVRNYIERVKNLEKRVDEMQEEAQKLEARAHEQQQAWDDTSEAIKVLEQQLKQAEIKYNPEQMKKYITIMTSQLGNAIAGLPHGLISLLQIEKEELKERLENFRAEIKGPKTIERVLVLKDKLAENGVSNKDITEEKIIQILIGHLEGEATERREKKIQSNIKQLTEANEEDLKTTERLAELVKKGAVHLKDIDSEIQNEFERFDRVKGKSAELDSIVNQLDVIKFDQLEDVNAMKQQLSDLSNDILNIERTCRNLLKELSEHRDVVNQEVKTKENVKKVELIDKVLVIIEQLQMVYEQKTAHIKELRAMLARVSGQIEKTENGHTKVEALEKRLNELEGKTKKGRGSSGSSSPAPSSSGTTPPRISTVPTQTVLQAPISVPTPEPPKDLKPHPESETAQAARPKLTDKGVIKKVLIDPTTKEEQLIKKFDLKGISFKIGSDEKFEQKGEGVTIRIREHDQDSSPDVDPHHATIVQEADGYYLYDENSSSGTSVNGLSVSSAKKLMNGDAIHVGRVTKIILKFIIKG